MAKMKCPNCRKPLPYAAQRCVSCGWSREGLEENDASRGPSPFARIRSGNRAAIIPAVAILIATGLTWTDRVALTESYGEFAARRLPVAFSAFAPVETATGAFYFCARLVVKEKIPSSSVEMFPTITPDNTRALGNGRYHIEAVLTENAEDGGVLEHAFSCIVDYRMGRWVLEELELE